MASSGRRYTSGMVCSRQYPVDFGSPVVQSRSYETYATRLRLMSLKSLARVAGQLERTLAMSGERVKNCYTRRLEEINSNWAGRKGSLGFVPGSCRGGTTCSLQEVHISTFFPG